MKGGLVLKKFINVSYEGELKDQPLPVKKEMNRQWEIHAEKVYFVGLLAGFAITLSAIFAYISGNRDFVSFGLAGIGVALSAYLSRKSNKYSYYLLFISVAVYLMGYAFLPYENNATFSLAIVATCGAVFDVALNIIAIKNYDTYEELKNEPGFPEFSLLSEMRAIELEKQKQFERERRVLLNNPDDSEFKYKVTEKDIKRKEYQEQIRKNAAENNKFTYPGRIFIYNKSIEDTTFSDKNKMMFAWNNFVNTTCIVLRIYLLVQIVATMFAMMDGGVGIVYIIFALINVYVSSSIKSYEKRGFIIYLISWAISFIVFFSVAKMCGTFIGRGLLAVNVLVGIVPVFPIIRCLLNFRLLTALSKEDGFPSFIRNTADELGSQMYILEKPPEVKLNDERYYNKTTDKAIYMDVGFDSPDKKPKEDTWNAFNYRDADDAGKLAEDISNSVFTGEVVEVEKSDDEKENSN